jgi:hypothetical protein
MTGLNAHNAIKLKFTSLGFAPGYENIRGFFIIFYCKAFRIANNTDMAKLIKGFEEFIVQKAKEVGLEMHEVPGDFKAGCKIDYNAIFQAFYTLLDKKIRQENGEYDK